MDIDPYLGNEWPLVLIVRLSNIIWILVDNINWILDDWCTCLNYRLKRNLVLPKCSSQIPSYMMTTSFDMCHMRCIKSNWDFIMITQVKSSRWEISFYGRNSPSQLYHNQLDYLKSYSDLICTQMYVTVCVWFRIQGSFRT